MEPIKMRTSFVPIELMDFNTWMRYIHTYVQQDKLASIEVINKAKEKQLMNQTNKILYDTRSRDRAS